jgi:hypothetical protein
VAEEDGAAVVVAVWLGHVSWLEPLRGEGGTDSGFRDRSRRYAGKWIIYPKSGARGSKRIGKCLRLLGVRARTSPSTCEAAMVMGRPSSWASGERVVFMMREET